jgi:hypothetical protein
LKIELSGADDGDATVVEDNDKNVCNEDEGDKINGGSVIASDNDPAAAVRILNLFRMIKAMNIRNKLQSKFPTLYMVSVDKVMNIESLKNNSTEIFAYVSGLALIDGKMKVISLSKTPSITADNSSHVALVTSDVPLAFICITIVKAKTTLGRSREPLGIVRMYAIRLL